MSYLPNPTSILLTPDILTLLHSGKISSLSVKPEGNTQTANVTFEKSTAAKTALLLDNTQLGSSLVHVSAASALGETSGGQAASTAHHDDDHVAQEDKPRARIIAEYLAHGYSISDNVIGKALDLDNQHGYSARFTSTLQSFDNKYHATEKAQQLDNKYGVTQTAVGALAGLNSYFEKALGTPTGQRVRAFYTAGNKQVMDVHTEARRLADLKSGKKEEPHKVAGSEKTVCSCGSAEGACGCAPGTCGCASCGKNKDADVPSAEEAQMETLAGGTRTKCNCGGTDGKCPCKC